MVIDADGFVKDVAVYSVRSRVTGSNRRARATAESAASSG